MSNGELFAPHIFFRYRAFPYASEQIFPMATAGWSAIIELLDTQMAVVKLPGTVVGLRGSF